jgi:AraC-like DNA-binding protein
MLFYQVKPCAALQPYVQCFWQFDSEHDSSSTDILFPSGNLEWVFNLGTATLVSVVGDQPVVTPRTELLGQITTAYSVQVQGRNRLLGVRFKPHAASLFLRSSVASLSNTITDLTDVFGAGIPRLQEQLSAAPTGAALEHVERFLLQILDHSQARKSAFRTMDFALHRLLTHPYDTTLAAVAVECGISTRYLHRLFLAFVGLSPSQFLKIIRLQRSIAYLHQCPGSLTAVAYASGYFDQSHFIREFKRFTGLTPSQYTPQDFPLNGPICRKR